jgi:hypothetical protein
MAKNNVFLKQSRKKQSGGLPGILYIYIFIYVIHFITSDHRCSAQIRQEKERRNELESKVTSKVARVGCWGQRQLFFRSFGGFFLGKQWKTHEKAGEFQQRTPPDLIVYQHFPCWKIAILILIYTKNKIYVANMLCPHLHPQKHPRPVVGSEGSVSTLEPSLQPILSRPDIYLAHFQEFSTIRFQIKFPPWNDTSLTTHIYHHISSYIYNITILYYIYILIIIIIIFLFIIIYYLSLLI